MIKHLAFELDICEKDMDVYQCTVDQNRNVRVAKGHQCQVCLHCFHTIEGLLEHLHRFEKTKPLQCGDCGRLFHTRHRALEHIAQHTNTMKKVEKLLLPLPQINIEIVIDEAESELSSEFHSAALNDADENPSSSVPNILSPLSSKSSEIPCNRTMVVKNYASQRPTDKKKFPLKERSKRLACNDDTCLNPSFPSVLSVQDKVVEQEAQVLPTLKTVLKPGQSGFQGGSFDSTCDAFQPVQCTIQDCARELPLVLTPMQIEPKNLTPSQVEWPKHFAHVQDVTRSPESTPVLNKVPDYTSPIGCQTSSKICGKEEKSIYQVGLRDNTLVPYWCKKCGDKFFTRVAMDYHMKNHPDSEIKYRCSRCSKDFGTKGQLCKHIMIHTGERPYACQICGKAFRSSSQLLIHHRTHTGEKPYECRYCGKKFGHGNALTDHERLHTGEKPYKCEVCGKNFAQKSTLRCHLLVHAPKDLKCDVCGFRTARKLGFREHMKTHGEREMFSCHLCQLDCTGKASLKQHLKRHENHAFLCKLCGRGFETKEKLSSHVKQFVGHPVLLCGECDKSFHTKNALLRHMAKHTGRHKAQWDTFSCDICNCGFSSKLSFDKHQQKFQNQKPFVCGHCGKKFHKQNTARAHVTTHVTADKDRAKL